VHQALLIVQMRLVIASAIWQAIELDRTLILPSYVYMRVRLRRNDQR